MSDFLFRDLSLSVYAFHCGDTDLRQMTIQFLDHMEMVNDHDRVRKCFLTDGAVGVIHIEAAHLNLSTFFQRDLEEIVFQVIQPARWKDIDRDLIIMIQQHTGIFTMFGTKRVYFIKIQMPWQGPSGDIDMMFKDRDDRGRGNVVASGNRAEGLVIAFEIFIRLKTKGFLS